MTDLRELGVRKLRTGVSWADWHRPGGRRWYRWQFEMLREFDVLLSVWHTPPSIAEGGVCAGPPRRLSDYADFVAELIDEHGDCFADLELWNEPNNRMKWDFARFDPEWKKFAQMVGAAAERARGRGKRTVLGGMIPVDPSWLQGVARHGGLEAVEVVAIHGFPEMWWEGAPNWDWFAHWRGWADKVERIAAVAGGRPIWITETGLATWDLRERRVAREALQVRMLEQAARAPADRVYWYCLRDLDPAREAIEGFHVDENEYHLGLLAWDGRRKPAWTTFARLLREGVVTA